MSETVDTIEPNPSYDADRSRRQELADMAAEISTAISELEMNNRDIVDAVALSVLEERFKLVVVGAFSTGKSTFINALLGQEVFPATPSPTTALICEVKWGEKCAFLHYPEDARPAEEVSVDAMKAVITIKDDDRTKGLPYDRVELFWPAALCRNQIEIIDTPGFEDTAERDETTTDYMSRSDAVLFVLNATQFGPSMAERGVLETIQEQGHRNPFFVVNKFDNHDENEQDAEDVRKRARKVLGTRYCSDAADCVFFISSKHALKGRRDDRPELVAKSGVDELESHLHRFLSEERSRVKAGRAGRVLEAQIPRIERAIASRRDHLGIRQEELKRRYANAQGVFDALDRDLKEIQAEIYGSRSDINELVTAKLRDFFDDLKPQIADWAGECKLDRGFDLDVKKKAEGWVAQVRRTLDREVDKAFKIWIKTTLKVFVGERIEDLQRDLERRTDAFESQVRKLIIDLKGGHLSSADLVVGQGSALDRTLGGGFEVGPLSSELSEVSWGDLAGSLLPTLGVGLIARGLGYKLIPVAAFATLVIDAIRIGIDIAKLPDRIRDKTVESYHQALAEAAPDYADQLNIQINKSLETLERRVMKGLRTLVGDVQTQVEAALRDLQQGGPAVEAKLAELRTLESQMKTTRRRLSTFLNSVESGSDQRGESNDA